ncbi:MAG: Ryanodine receptor Ryr [Rikenellaceae bacterium]|nr:Ryanodine receptor Ryr [Rikenellaceae bacterium]
MNSYNPRPIDLSDVELPAELVELREAIAENAHDVWAAERQAQGWTYGPTRDDAKRQTPCMVPYSQLPDSEKKFDRDMAVGTIKLLKKLGYDIVKHTEK